MLTKVNLCFAKELWRWVGNVQRGGQGGGCGWQNFFLQLKNWNIQVDLISILLIWSFSWKPPRLSLHVELRNPKKNLKAVGKKEEGVEKKEEVQRKVEEEELVNKVAQLRAKTSGVLDQIFQTIKKEENLDKNEEIITRRREKNFDETKVLMRVGQTRGRGKGSGILEQVSDKNDGSFLRVTPDL